MEVGGGSVSCRRYSEEWKEDGLIMPLLVMLFSLSLGLLELLRWCWLWWCPLVFSWWVSIASLLLLAWVGLIVGMELLATVAIEKVRSASSDQDESQQLDDPQSSAVAASWFLSGDVAENRIVNFLLRKRKRTRRAGQCPRQLWTDSSRKINGQGNSTPSARILVRLL